MYSIYYNGREYDVPERLFYQVAMCLIQFKEAKIIDKPIFIELFRSKYIRKILVCPALDYSRVDELENVLSTQEIAEAY